MSFAEEFNNYKNRIIRIKDSLSDMTEEATKNAIIMPFFVLLGYDVFNPEEIVPEYICDVANKKGEKIDYAIMHDNEPIILVEVKRAGMKLQKQQQGQLFRYFSTSRCRIAVLTNGINYLFFSDVNSPNVMDDEPFFAFNIFEDDESVYLSSLEQFSKFNFNIKTILSKAVFLKYEKVVEKTILEDLSSPSDEIVKYFLNRPEIKTGSRITAQMIDKFRESTRKAMLKAVGATICDISQHKQEISNKEPNEPKNVPEKTIEKDTFPAVCEESINYIKSLCDDLEFDYILLNGTHSVNISKDGNPIGRLRVSSKPPIRYDYTKYSDQSYKMFLLKELSEIKNCL